MDKLQDFIKTTEGKEVLRKHGVYSGVSKDEVKAIANDLKNMLVQYSTGVCKSCNSLLDSDSIRVNRPTEQKDGRYKITLTINKDDLKRDSLLNKAPWNGGKPIGTGVYDIVGLYTQGYTAKKYAYGWWDSESTFIRTHSLINGVPGLKPHDFIDRAINDFRTKYANYKMDITYPSLWHSK